MTYNKSGTDTFYRYFFKGPSKAIMCIAKTTIKQASTLNAHLMCCGALVPLKNSLRNQHLNEERKLAYATVHDKPYTKSDIQQSE